MPLQAPDLHAGVGPVLAFSLIAWLPELGHMSRKQIAALVNLAPYDCDSGKLKGCRSIYGGRRPVRKVLYMAALSASRYNPAPKPSAIASPPPAKSPRSSSSPLCVHHAQRNAARRRPLAAPMPLSPKHS